MTTFGVDVSFFQPKVDWPGLVLSGHGGFAYARACDGHVLDKMHDTHISGARGAGIPIGSYIYAHPTMDVIQLADFFLEHADWSELRPVVDMETLCAGNIVPPNASAWADAWCERVKARTGTEPIIYASTSYWRTMCGLKPDIGGALGWSWWAAQYGGTSPPGCVAWQFAGNVPLVGQAGLWDVDQCSDVSRLYV